MNSKIKSEIYGNGYGSKHCWVRGYTPQGVDSIYEKYTQYSCKCGESFCHYYDLVPNIFETMKTAGVKEDCLLNGTKS
jgi:hypothetical protein